MKVLLAFEESGTVTREFLRLGHDAWSCDLLPTSGDHPSRHFREDAREVMTDPWDLVIAFPPSTHLARSGARYWPEKQRDGRQQEAAALFMSATRANAPRIAIENPRGIMTRLYRRPDQVIHPWEHGHGETKATCLWLHRLPPLMPTELVPERVQRILNMSPSPDRARQRSVTYPGIARAMADQWGGQA